MEKLDRLGWTAGISFLSYGLRVGVRVNEPHMLDRLKHSFPPGWMPLRPPVVDRLYSIWSAGISAGRGIQRFNLLYVDIEQAERARDIGTVISSFESDLHLYLAEHARQKIFIHAGAVGWKGKAILIPGRTMSGKTTLVAELVKAGATYYSDEFAVLDGRGRIHPFAGPLGMRNRVNLAQKKLAVSELGGVCGTDPLPAGLVVFCQYKSGALWRPRLLSPGRAALMLLANAAAARRKPKAALKTLQKVVLQAPVLKGTRGEASSIVRSIMAVLENQEA
jgi:hypothetical protein